MESAEKRKSADMQTRPRRAKLRKKRQNDHSINPYASHSSFVKFWHIPGVSMNRTCNIYYTRFVRRWKENENILIETPGVASRHVITESLLSKSWVVLEIPTNPNQNTALNVNRSSAQSSLKVEPARLGLALPKRTCLKEVMSGPFWVIILPLWSDKRCPDQGSCQQPYNQIGGYTNLSYSHIDSFSAIIHCAACYRKDDERNFCLCQIS